MLCQILAVLSVKMAMKNDCLTSCYIKQKIHPNLGNSQKLCTNFLCTSDYYYALLKRSAQYLVFVFLPSQKEAKRINNVQ